MSTTCARSSLHEMADTGNQKRKTPASSRCLSFLVRLKGLEPTRIAAREPKSRMSTNSITGAYSVLKIAGIAAGSAIPPYPLCFPSPHEGYSLFAVLFFIIHNAGPKVNSNPAVSQLCKKAAVLSSPATPPEPPLRRPHRRSAAAPTHLQPLHRSYSWGSGTSCPGSCPRPRP